MNTVNTPVALMQALAIAMVKNEADIIEASIRHNLAFVDLIAVIDNASSDGTREILEALRAEGLPLLIFDDPVFGHFQSEKVTHVYRKVAPVFNPELVYLLDADEFIRAPSREALEAALRPLAPGSQAWLPWATHLPDPAAAPDAALRDPLGAAPWRRRQEEPLYFKAVVRRQAADDAVLVVEQGNHAVRLADGRPVPAVRVQGVAVSHLPVRSVDQISAKVINGWQACLVRNRHRNVPGEAFQWQHLYTQITQGRALTADQLVGVALDYAQTARPGRSLSADAVRDPAPARYGELKHLSLGRHSALAKVALGMQAALAPAPDPGPPGGPALDLAPMADLARRQQAGRVLATPAGERWRQALQPGAAGAATLLLAPELAAADVPALAVDALQGPADRVVFWSAQPRDATALGLMLQAWAARGWEPDLMQTLCLRALASYAWLRHDAVVLRRQDARQADRAPAVAAVLCAFAAHPHAWQDPPAQTLQHPLQALRLGEPPSPPAQESRAEAALLPA